MAAFQTSEYADYFAQLRETKFKRFKKSLEEICEKYSEVTPEDEMDVIDINRLEIVVDNNYIRNMKSRPFAFSSPYRAPPHEIRKLNKIAEKMKKSEKQMKELHKTNNGAVSKLTFSKFARSKKKIKNTVLKSCLKSKPLISRKHFLNDRKKNSLNADIHQDIPSNESSMDNILNSPITTPPLKYLTVKLFDFKMAEKNACEKRGKSLTYPTEISENNYSQKDISSLNEIEGNNEPSMCENRYEDLLFNSPCESTSMSGKNSILNETFVISSPKTSKTFISNVTSTKKEIFCQKDISSLNDNVLSVDKNRFEDLLIHSSPESASIMSKKSISNAISLQSTPKIGNRKFSTATSLPEINYGQKDILSLNEIEENNASFVDENRFEDLFTNSPRESTSIISKKSISNATALQSTPKICKKLTLKVTSSKKTFFRQKDISSLNDNALTVEENRFEDLLRHSPCKLTSIISKKSISNATSLQSTPKIGKRKFPTATSQELNYGQKQKDISSLDKTEENNAFSVDENRFEDLLTNLPCESIISKKSISNPTSLQSTPKISKKFISNATSPLDSTLKICKKSISNATLPCESTTRISKKSFSNTLSLRDSKPKICMESIKNKTSPYEPTLKVGKRKFSTAISPHESTPRISNKSISNKTSPSLLKGKVIDDIISCNISIL